MQQVRSGPGPFLPTSLPRPRSRSWRPGRISAPCWPGVPRPPAPIPHPWAFPPRPQPHEATSSSLCDTPKAALLGTVEPAGTLEPGEPGGWRGLGCRGGDGGRVGSQEVRTPGAGLPVQNPSATSRLAAWRPLSSRPVGLTPSPPCISHPPPCPLASFHVQRLGFRAVLGLCQGDTLSV